MGAYESLIRRVWRGKMRRVERRIQRTPELGRPDDGSSPWSGPPVLLVPGYGNDERSMGAIQRSLLRDGIRAEAITLPDFGMGDALTDTTFLVERVRAFAREHGASVIDLVGHSRGGLVSRAAQQELDGLVGRVVTLSSANRGIPFGAAAMAAMPAGMRQIRSVTPFMRDLGAGHATGRFDVVTVGTSGIDWLLVPASVTWLDGTPATVIDEGRRLGPMSRLTHYTMLRDDRTYEAIRDALKQPRARAIVVDEDALD